RLLGSESAGLAVADDVAWEAFRRGVALVLGECGERARVILAGVHVVLGFMASPAVLLPQEVVPRDRGRRGRLRRSGLHRRAGLGGEAAVHLVVECIPRAIPLVVGGDFVIEW